MFEGDVARDGARTGGPSAGVRSRLQARPEPGLSAAEPGEFVGSAAVDAQPAAVDAAQVVEGAEGDLVLELVAAELRTEEDMVRVGRP